MEWVLVLGSHRSFIETEVASSLSWRAFALLFSSSDFICCHLVIASKSIWARFSWCHQAALGDKFRSKMVFFLQKRRKVLGSSFLAFIYKRVNTAFLSLYRKDNLKHKSTGTKLLFKCNSTYFVLRFANICCPSIQRRRRRVGRGWVNKGESNYNFRGKGWVGERWASWKMGGRQGEGKILDLKEMGSGVEGGNYWKVREWDEGERAREKGNRGWEMLCHQQISIQSEQTLYCVLFEEEGWGRGNFCCMSVVHNAMCAICILHDHVMVI